MLLAILCMLPAIYGILYRDQTMTSTSSIKSLFKLSFQWEMYLNFLVLKPLIKIIAMNPPNYKLNH